MAGLPVVLHVSDSEPARLLRSTDEHCLNWVVTDAFGYIIDASAEAAVMLNTGARHMRKRSLLMYFDGDRRAWAIALKDAAEGTSVQRSGRLRPRDRRPRVVDVQLAEALDYPKTGVLWTFADAAASTD